MIVFDVILVCLLVWLGWRAVNDANAWRAVVKFIVLGLVLSLAWLRLGAPDVALAEAAVGSGLTGALLLAALRRQRRLASADRGGESEGKS